MPATKKSPARKSPIAKKEDYKEVVKHSVETQTSIPKTSRNKRILFILLIIFAAALLYYFKSLIFAASVNGEFITRVSVIKELEKGYGKQALEAEITKTLIKQEAKKQNLVIDQSEIDKEISAIEKNLKQQGQDLNQALELRGMKKEDLIDQIRLQKTVEKMAAKDVKITDKEVDEYIQKYNVEIPEGTDPKIVKENIKTQLLQQKTGEKVQNWLSDLQKKANITYFLNY